MPLSETTLGSPQKDLAMASPLLPAQLRISSEAFFAAYGVCVQYRRSLAELIGSLAELMGLAWSCHWHEDFVDGPCDRNMAVADG